mgnify:CR=1 FL=1
MTIMLQIPTLVLLCAMQGADGSGKPEIPAFQLNAAEQERILDLFQATEEKISADGTVDYDRIFKCIPGQDFRHFQVFLDHIHDASACHMGEHVAS